MGVGGDRLVSLLNKITSRRQTYNVKEQAHSSDLGSPYSEQSPVDYQLSCADGKTREAPVYVICFMFIFTHCCFIGAAASYSWACFLAESDSKLPASIVQLAGSGCALVATIIFYVNYFLHIANYVSRDIQRQYVRILMMTPILSVQAWLLMYFPTVEIAFEPFSECYKAFTLYCVLHVFVYFLDQNQTGSAQLHEKLPVRQLIGLHVCFPAIPTCTRLSRTTIIGTVQSMIFRPLSTLVILITGLMLGSAPLGFYFAKCLNVFQWASQCYAIYSVLLWARTFRSELSSISPIIKHFGLMFFHILLPTLVPQVMDIVLQYQIIELDEDSRQTSEHMFTVSRGCFQAASCLFGSVYLSWMYSIRDNATFSPKNQQKRALAIADLFSSRDIFVDRDLMKGACGKCRVPVKHVNTASSPSGYSPIRQRSCSQSSSDDPQSDVDPVILA